MDVSFPIGPDRIQKTVWGWAFLRGQIITTSLQCHWMIRIGVTIQKIALFQVSELIYPYIPGLPKAAFFWSGLKSSERPKIEQLLNLPSVSHIWKDQKYDTK